MFLSPQYLDLLPRVYSLRQMPQWKRHSILLESPSRQEPTKVIDLLWSLR